MGRRQPINGLAPESKGILAMIGIRGFVFSLAAMPLAAMLLVAASGEARAVRGICIYTIYVKSSHEGIQSTQIRNGRMQVEGHAPARERSFAPDSLLSTRGGDIARDFAGTVAKRCLDAAVRQSTKPAICRRKQNYNSVISAQVVRFRISNLQQEAQNAICDAARALGKGPKLRGVSIWVKLVGRLNARRRLCYIKDGDKNATYVVRSRIRVICGRLGGRAVNQRKRVYTGWYPERGSKVRARVATFCKQRYSTTRFTVHRFEIKPNSGRIRAQFSCN